jgi:hypothetical protein
MTRFLDLFLFFLSLDLNIQISSDCACVFGPAQSYISKGRALTIPVLKGHYPKRSRGYDKDGYILVKGRKGTKFRRIGAYRRRHFHSKNKDLSHQRIRDSQVCCPKGNYCCRPSGKPSWDVHRDRCKLTAGRVLECDTRWNKVGEVIDARTLADRSRGPHTGWGWGDETLEGPGQIQYYAWHKW